MRARRSKSLSPNCIWVFTRWVGHSVWGTCFTEQKKDKTSPAFFHSTHELTCVLLLLPCITPIILESLCLPLSEPRPPTMPWTLALWCVLWPCSAYHPSSFLCPDFIPGSIYMYLRFVNPTPCFSSPSSLPFLKLVFFMHFWMSMSTSVPPTFSLQSLPLPPWLHCNCSSHSGFTSHLVMHLPADEIQPLLPLSLISCTLPPYSCSSSPTNLLFIIQPAQILVHFQAWVLVLPTAPDSLPMLSHSWFILISWVLAQIFTLREAFPEPYMVCDLGIITDWAGFIGALLRGANDGWSCSSYCSHIFPHQLKTETSGWAYKWGIKALGLLLNSRSIHHLSDIQSAQLS